MSKTPMYSKILRSLATVGVVATLTSASANDEIFLSEYLEGTQADGTFNLALEIYLDGSPTASQTMNWGELSSLLIQPDDVFVLVQVTADPELLARADDTVFGLWPLDGNDAIALRRGGVIVDVIGQIGFDPGPGGWGSGNTTTTDHTLRRKPSVCGGDADGSDPFDPVVEWDGFPVDTFDGFGFHEADCSKTPSRDTTWGNVKSRFRRP